MRQFPWISFVHHLNSFLSFYWVTNGKKTTVEKIKKRTFPSLSLAVDWSLPTGLAFLHRFLCVNNNELKEKEPVTGGALKRILISFYTCLSINFLFTFSRTESGTRKEKWKLEKRTCLQQKGQLRIIEALILFSLIGLHGNILFRLWILLSPFVAWTLFNLRKFPFVTYSYTKGVGKFHNFSRCKFN